MRYKKLTNNVVTVSGEQWRDLTINIHVSILPQISFPSSLPHHIEQSSLCYIIGPCISINAVQNSKEYLFDKIPNYYTFQDVPMFWPGPDHIVNFPEAGCHLVLLPKSPATSVLVYTLWTQYFGGREGKNGGTGNFFLKCLKYSSQQI